MALALPPGKKRDALLEKACLADLGARINGCPVSPESTPVKTFDKVEAGKQVEGIDAAASAKGTAKANVYAAANADAAAAADKIDTLVGADAPPQTPEPVIAAEGVAAEVPPQPSVRQ